MTKNEAIELAIKDIKRVDHEYYGCRSDASRYRFDYGISAKKQSDIRQQAIIVLNGLKDMEAE